MRIDEGMDTGPILLQAEEPIREDDTAITLGQRLATRGAELMVETLRGLEAGTLTPQPQDHSLASKARLLKREHGRLDFSLPARDLYNRIRGLLPWPGAFTNFRGQRLHLWWGKPVAAPTGLVQTLSPGTSTWPAGKVRGWSWKNSNPKTASGSAPPTSSTACTSAPANSSNSSSRAAAAYCSGAAFSGGRRRWKPVACW
jgi:hypothetical protein